jgi:hypothetical protein
MIFVFGNSHAHVFTNTHPATFGMGNKNERFTSFSLGPTIAYNFFEHHYPTMLNWIEQLNINKENDYIVLAIGEVDCRWHLPYQASIQGKTNEVIVSECIDRYFRVYLDLKNKGYNIIGWGGHPSTISGHNDDQNEPVFGDCLSRNKISLLWNNLLKENCKKNNIDFISIIEDLIDEDGLTRMEYFSDYCHLSYAMVEEIIFEKFKNYIN